MAMNGRALNGRYIGSESEHSESDSQGTTQQVDDWMYNPNNPGGHPEHRLSVIPEHMEGVVEMSPRHLGSARSSPDPPLPRGTRGRTGMSFTVPVYMHQQDSDSEVRPEEVGGKGSMHALSFSNSLEVHPPTKGTPLSGDSGHLSVKSQMCSFNTKLPLKFIQDTSQCSELKGSSVTVEGAELNGNTTSLKSRCRVALATVKL